MVAATRRPVRNVALVGHSGAGKTTLLEALLVATGALARPGRVEDGSTVSDFDEAEARQGRSINLAAASVTYQDVTLTLLDTPGYADFVGELRAGLRAADAALFVVGAVDGVDGATRALWEECAAIGLPRAVVVTRLDQPRADFEDTVARCQQAFGAGVLPLYLPLHDDESSVGGLFGLISAQVYDYTGGQRSQRPAEPEHLPLVEQARGELIEAIIAESEDETLLDRYLAGEQIEAKMLIDDLEKAVARGTLFPVLAASGSTGLGAAELLELLVGAFPCPAERPLPVVTTPAGEPVAPLTGDADGPLVAEVVKTSTDAYVGRLSLVRVFSGTLRPDAAVHVSGHTSGRLDHDVDERVGALASPFGAALRPVTECRAGEICAVSRLSHAETGDTLSDKDSPLLVEAWQMPEPLLPVAIEAASRADEDKLGQALARLVAEDPTVRLERHPETHQTVLWCLGEAHADVLLDRLASRHHVQVRTVELRVPLRETFSRPSSGHGRHVKQSGGHGQFAVCDLQVSPLPPGEGFHFVDKVVGGAIPHTFIASIEKGVRAQMERGLLAGYPVVDIEVTVVDGKTHSVDSSDLAFQLAGALALQEAAVGCVQLLEPLLEVTVLVSDEHVGAVLGDLASRRGRVLGTEPVGDSGRTLISAQVPETELVRYAVDLRSLSHGTGSFTRRPARYEVMPANLASKIAAVP